jgi:glycerol uptake facilitator-like aquaporin
MILIIFGNGVNCQVVLGGNEAVSASAQGVSGLISTQQGKELTVSH